MRFEFVHAEKANFPVTLLCRVLEVSTSGYYRWRKAAPSRRARDDARLKPTIAAIYAESRQTYGSPRVHAEIVEQGLDAGRHRIARLMREMGLSAAPTKRFRVTTNSRHGRGYAPDLVKRDFEPTEPNRLWVSDITYVWTDDGWAYLAVVLDLFSRRVVGWAIDDNMRDELVLDALDRALELRDTGEDLVHHSDRGGQYASKDFRARLDGHGIAWSMGATGCCYDNAAAESFFATLKKDLVHRKRYRDLAAARGSISEYIHLFYNSRRRHSSLGYISPNDFEARYHQDQPKAALAA